MKIANSGATTSNGATRWLSASVGVCGSKASCTVVVALIQAIYLAVACMLLDSATLSVRTAVDEPLLIIAIRIGGLIVVRTLCCISPLLLYDAFERTLR